MGSRGIKTNTLSTSVKDISCINLAKTIDLTDLTGFGRQFLKFIQNKNQIWQAGGGSKKNIWYPL